MAEELEQFDRLLEKAILLKDFAVKNGYELDPKTIEDLNQLRYRVGQSSPAGNRTADDQTKLDAVVADLTSVTFPTTIDSLSSDSESVEYVRFKSWLWKIGLAALILAIIGFAAVAVSMIPLQISNSLLALSLGALGAVTYSFFNVLRVVPPQAFNPRDEYSNYARLLLGVLLGWVFYFAFARGAFQSLPSYLSGKPESADRQNWTVAFLLLAPFVAGYSTKFVVGVLDRVIAALETTLGIEEKRDVSRKRRS